MVGRSGETSDLAHSGIASGKKLPLGASLMGDTPESHWVVIILLAKVVLDEVTFSVLLGGILIFIGKLIKLFVSKLRKFFPLDYTRN